MDFWLQWCGKLIARFGVTARLLVLSYFVVAQILILLCNWFHTLQNCCYFTGGRETCRLKSHKCYTISSPIVDVYVVCMFSNNYFVYFFYMRDFEALAGWDLFFLLNCVKQVIVLSTILEIKSLENFFLKWSTYPCIVVYFLLYGSLRPLLYCAL